MSESSNGLRKLHVAALISGAIAGVSLIAGALVLQNMLATALWAMVILSLFANDASARAQRTQSVSVILVVVISMGVMLAMRDLSIGDALRVLFVVMTFGLAVLGISRVVRHAGIASVIAILWLTWPMWTARIIVGMEWELVVDRMVSISSPFVLNMLIEPGDVLTHRPLAYRYLTLGQDTSYAMPTTIAWCIAFQLLVASPVIVELVWGVIRGAMTARAKPGIIGPM